jgi:hypothetical protein
MTTAGRGAPFQEWTSPEGFRFGGPSQATSADARGPARPSAAFSGVPARGPARGSGLRVADLMHSEPPEPTEVSDLADQMRHMTPPSEEEPYGSPRETGKRGPRRPTPPGAFPPPHTRFSVDRAPGVKREISPLQVPASVMGRGPDSYFVQRPAAFTNQTSFAEGVPVHNVDYPAQWDIQPVVGSAASVVDVPHPPSPSPVLNDVVPWRDSANPINRVHPDFAAEDGSLHDKVQLRGLTLGMNPRNLNKLFTFITGHGLSESDLQLLRRDAEAEMRLLMDNSRPNARRRESSLSTQTEVYRITEALPHEEGLVGQRGLRARQELDAGEFLGFYAGILNADREMMADQHPGFEQYELDAVNWRANRRAPSYSAMPASNSAAFANTALLPDRSDYDWSRINAGLMTFGAGITNRDGRPRNLDVVGLFTYRLIRQGDPILLDYGPGYLPQFQAPSERDQRAARRDGPGRPEVKPEPEPQSLAAAATAHQPQRREDNDYVTFVVESSLRADVNAGRLDPQTIPRLIERLRNRINENPGMNERYIVEEALRTYWQNAPDDQKSFYSKLMRAAQNRRGG